MSAVDIVENVKKIAILRANALGDLIVTLPAIKAIRHAYPHAEIILLGKELHKEFLAGRRTEVDRVIVIPVSKGLREEKDMKENPAELDQFFHEIKKEEIDIAIHFHGQGIAANPFIRKLGAKLTVGMTCAEAEPLDRSIPFYYYQNEVMRYLEVVSLIGADRVSIEPEIKILETDREEASVFINRYINKPFIVLHPCGTDIRRSWTKEKFAKTSDLFSKKGYTVVLTGSMEDNETAHNIISLAKYNAVNACGKLSLGGLASLLSQSELVVASDTGPLHLARAAGARTVGIYWAPNLINWGPLTRNDHRPVVSWKMHCPGCGIIPNSPWPFEPRISHCDHNFSFVADITAEQVLEQAGHLLRTKQPGRSNNLAA